MTTIYDKMLEGIGKFFNRKSKTAGKTYDSFFVYIPTEIARDSGFPLNDKDKVKIRVEDKRVIIEKAV